MKISERVEKQTIIQPFGDGLLDPQIIIHHGQQLDEKRIKVNTMMMTVTIDEAEQFIEALQKAIEIAKSIAGSETPEA